MKDLQVKVAVKIGGDVIGNLFHTALTDGYWHRLPKETKETINKYREDGEDTGDAIWKAVSNREQLKVRSVDSDEGIVSEFFVLKALQKIADEDPERMGRIVDGQFDFEDADAFFQEVVFEKIIFG